MGQWGPPLRIARRTARRSLGRTLLVAALIGLPVLAATWLGIVLKSAHPSGETLANNTIGRADARLDVTQYDKVQVVPGQEIYGEPPPADGHDKAVRTPGTFDPLPLLPPGSKIARQLVDGGMAELRTPDSRTSATLIVGDGASPLAAGTVKVDKGRMPAKADEVAISPALAEKLGSTGTVVSADGTKYTVVGIARMLLGQSLPTVFGTPDIALAEPDPTRTVSYLVDLPDSADPGRLGPKLVDQGLFLLPRATIIDPPPAPYGTSAADIGPYAAMALVIGFGILEIVLLAGTAFAVGARRQTRELGLVMAAGGTPGDVRRIVLVQGLFAGLVGVLGGLVVAGAAVFSAKPLWEAMTDSIFTAWQIPWGTTAGIAVLGVGAGLAAAVVPAISAGRQAPMAALAGRFAVTAKAARIRVVAVVLLVGGLVCVFAGSAQIAAALKSARNSQLGTQATATPNGPIALVLVGITAAVIALVWMLPSLVAKAAGLARVLPLSGRMALRDASRHRHRTGPATAAIMMAVAGTAAVAFAAANSIAADEANYVAVSKHGNAVLRFDNGVPGAQAYRPELITSLDGILPVRQQYELGDVLLPNAKANQYGYTPVLAVATPQNFEGSNGFALLSVDPAFVAKFGAYGEQAAAALRDGKVVLPGVPLKAGQKVALHNDDSDRMLKNLDAVSFGTPPAVHFLRDTALISPAAARQLGTIRVSEVHFELTRDPSKDQLAAVSRLLGTDDGLKVEKGYQNPGRLFLIGVLAAATVVTLLGVAISVSLSAAEGRADLATLAAIGAPPRRRRSLAAAQAWVLGQLGCVLGVGVGALYGFTAHAAFGSPRFTVPWAELGGIVVAVPLFAGLLAWLLTRSRLPMVSRVD
ncbi:MULTISPECIES: ABC transporter permease [Kribbella]|uniref:ABC3 transporter permease C-terminal domain-containing protein n=1 Tax=Kribbella karoonensis TaxID=324851 RepID=A0ABN2DCE1_9ACTN